MTVAPQSPLAYTVAEYANSAVANYQTLNSVISATKSALASYGVSNLTQLAQKPLTTAQRNEVNSAYAYLVNVENSFSRSEAGLESGLAAVVHLEATSYKSPQYSQTSFNSEDALFAAYDKGVYNELIEIETLL